MILKQIIFFISASLLFNSTEAQIRQVYFNAVSASANQQSAALVYDNNVNTGWSLNAKDVKRDQYIFLTLQKPRNINGLDLKANDLSKSDLQKLLSVFVTYDPMNPGNAVAYNISGDKDFHLAFSSKYGAYIKLFFKGDLANKSFSINEINVDYTANDSNKAMIKNKPWLNPKLSINERVKDLLAVMTPAQKMELLREGWGIPGIPSLGIPFVNKVEAIHGFSYGSGATIFPQSIALAATWDKNLVEKVSETIGDETVSAHTLQAWSPVLDVAQDPRWGRCEETYGEDPVLVSGIGGAWIKGFQSKGLMVTPKHFAGHGAPLGGRDSHDIGLSEREMREIHLVPFRHVIEKYKCQSIMVSYSAFEGVPNAKSKELLKGILREEWGFNGFVVSDCGAIGNLTSRKHYTATNVVEAANEALAAGVATNCGDTYNNPHVIDAAKNGNINMDNLNYTCSTLLETMFRNGLFENNPAKSLDWNKIYPRWNSHEHKELARQAEREAIVLLKNENNILPLSKATKTIAVIGPGADDLQPGDYTAKLQPGQLVSVLSGIKQAVGNSAKVIYKKGCEFFSPDSFPVNEAVAAAQKADVAVLVLGDCSTSESIHKGTKTSGEANDYSSLILPGNQEKLLEAVCATGKPVILILQSGRPYNLSYASEHCKAILVNWLPGEEGGPATADVLFGDYSPAGRLPMTFPRSVSQEPLYYNFKTSGRGYNYVDMDFKPLYPFGFGLSYTTFNYSNLKTDISNDGTVKVQATVTNMGKSAGDEVVQLYVTDMYASVKTRVMELKDFNRIHLNAGESKNVSFTLTPYQFSLLNDEMDRVVEPGEFKICVGTKSPDFIAGNEIKNSVGFATSSEGVDTIIYYKKSFSAQFIYRIGKIDSDPISGKKRIVIMVKNKGNLTDVGKLRMYVDNILKDEVHHFEVAPGEEKPVYFNLNGIKNYHHLVFAGKYKIVSKIFNPNEQ